MLPYRETISISLNKRTQRDGTPELVAFFESTINGWSPMIAVWPCSDDLETSQEDTITLNGMVYAYCISDDQASSFNDLVAIDDPSDCDWPTAMFIIGSLMRHVI
jgi:hypothetical protein